MRQRYAYGSNIAAVRCGWDVKIKEQWRIKDCNIQSGAVLWLRHSFARAFSGDSIKKLPICHCERAKRARQSTVRESRIIKDSMPFDCFASLAMTQDYHKESQHG
ncbi:MAG: hypothetical protein K2H55_02225, partial [Helicobacter sp.]|nr:hypothetical protein [Helicobacter sp.]